MLFKAVARVYVAVWTNKLGRFRNSGFPFFLRWRRHPGPNPSEKRQLAEIPPVLCVVIAVLLMNFPEPFPVELTIHSRHNRDDSIATFKVAVFDVPIKSICNFLKFIVSRYA